MTPTVPSVVTPCTSKARALIIGINDYSRFDPTGGNNLKGGAQDVLLVAQICARLGMDPETGIECLWNDVASPGNSELVPAKPGCEPTLAGIEAALGRLKAHLESGQKGLLWYSGHGAYQAGHGLLLCPSDIARGPDGKGFVNALSLERLSALLGEAAAKNLTVVLDCCHGGPATGASAVRPTLTPDAGAQGPVKWNLDVSLRIHGATVLAACAPGETTQQSWFFGYPHGAFTWALLCVANQWRYAQQGPDNVVLDLSYRELIKRTTALLGALDLDGTPQIWPQPHGALSVLQLGDENLGASATPTANRGHVQVDPNLDIGCSVYEMVLNVTGADPSPAYVASMGGTSYGAYSASTEYWGGTPASAFQTSWMTATSTANGGSLTFNTPQLYTNQGPPAGWYGGGRNEQWQGNETSDMTNTTAWRWRAMSTGPSNTMWWPTTANESTYWGLSFDGVSFTWYCYTSEAVPPGQKFVVSASTMPRSGLQFVPGAPQVKAGGAGYGFFQLTPG